MVTLVLLGVSGCKKEVLHRLDEIEANRVIVVLAKQGIQADKEPDVSDKEPRYKILTDEEHAVRASEILLELDLPRKKERGLADVYATPSMIPTDMEEKARNLLALQGELASTLEQIEGVVDARVHLVLPEMGLLGGGVESARGGQASVLVKHEVVKRRGGTELSEQEQLEKYRGMLISMQGDLREVREALNEELPDTNKRDLGAINTIDLYLDKHRDDRDARNAMAALNMLKESSTSTRDRLAYLSALPKVKDLDETLARIKEIEIQALPFASAGIRALVAGAISGLTPDDVSVQFARVVREEQSGVVASGYATGIDKTRFFAVAGAAGLMTLMFLGALLWARGLRKKLKAAEAARPKAGMSSVAGGG
jgi:type III secretion system YscJ/HrcJ family lipoprotein